jgi:hypothetical protein
MTPEPNPCARHQAGFQVHIRYGRRRLHSACGRNPSHDGLYLEVRSVTLPEGTPVELEIKAKGRLWLVPAVVARHDASGIEVSFIEPQPDLVAELSQVDAQPLPATHYAPARGPLLQRHGHRA